MQLENNDNIVELKTPYAHRVWELRDGKWFLLNAHQVATAIKNTKSSKSNKITKNSEKE